MSHLLSPIHVITGNPLGQPSTTLGRNVNSKLYFRFPVVKNDPDRHISTKGHKAMIRLTFDDGARTGAGSLGNGANQFKRGGRHG